MIETIVTKDAARKRSVNHDRAKGTLSDGLKQKDSENNSKYHMDQNNEKGLRDQLNHLFACAMTLRGNNSRMFQLADFFVMDLPKEGPQIATALVAIMNNGKCNVDGRNEYGVCMRSKVVTECPTGAMAMYLFSRFEVNEEEFPDLQRQAEWYPIVLYKDKSPKSAMTYEQERNNTKKSHLACKVKSTKVTHAPRVFSATKTLSNGASHDHVRQAGRWTGGKMERCYLNDLPRVAMRIQAGFTKKPGQYYLKRAVIVPSEELCDQIFAKVKWWKAHLEDPEYYCDGDLTAHNFVELMTYLRVVLIQDSVEMMRAYPDLFIWIIRCGSLIYTRHTSVKQKQCQTRSRLKYRYKMLYL